MYARLKKNVLLARCLYILSSAAAAGQNSFRIEPNLKYGKPSDAELALTDYPPDTAATAVMLFHTGKSYFKYSRDFQFYTEHCVRIKVLKPEGAGYADVTIPYYAPDNKESDKEGILRLNACAYNLEGGKCVKTPMPEEYIVKERVDPTTCVVKFTVPAVRAGTVIEYRYTLLSGYYQQIDNWLMQENIPVVYNQYEIVIPSLLIYGIELRGKDHIRTEEKNSTLHITVTTGGGRTQVAHDMSVPARKLIFTARDLAAMKQDEPYCWYPDDYKVQVCFELEGFNYPEEDYQPYTKDWAGIDKLLQKEDDETFGKQLRLDNPLREDMKQYSWQDLSTEEKAAQAFRILKDRIAWDGRYRLQSPAPLEALKKGTGSNADINFIFLSMLRDLAIPAYPVVLSRRDRGMLPVTHPSLQRLNTFVVALADPKGKYSYLDGSMAYPCIDALPQVLLAEQARLIGPQPENEKWVNLMSIGSHTVQSVVTARIAPDSITGSYTASYSGQTGNDFRSRYFQAADSNAYAAQIGIRLKGRVENYRQEGAETGKNRVREEFDFACKTERSGDLLYINPMILPHIAENPFTQTERELPVEFPYRYTYQSNVTLTLPEGYGVEELPDNKSYVTENSGITCKYLIRQVDNQINLRYSFTLKQDFVPSEQYRQLQTFWNEVVERNNAVIVLKKL